MRVVRYHEHGGPDVLQVDEVERPSPDGDEVVVEIRAASVNPVDTMFRSGEYGDVNVPAIPGGDGAGTVVEVGADVDAFDVGDRVFASGMGHAEGGTTAEYVAFPAMKLARLPEGVPFEVGGAIGNVGATAWTALERIAGIDAGDRVLIHGGAGGVGHVAVQLAASAGAAVIATVGSDDLGDRVRELGATTVLNYDSDTLAADVLDATDGSGVEIVLDHMLEEYLELDFEVVAPGGHIVTTMGGVPATDGAPLRNKEVTLRGMSLGNRAERRDILQRLCRLMERGELTAVVADSYDLEDAGRAHRDVLEGGSLGKLIVTP
ncbi:NADPH:quinone reductase [Natrinema longum]|uniref:NADPH:quinone reductase n=1 Tax=Natrinema longum TaxID=370324 RepID=A0A8A2UD15_9EURY|nr:NADPH:quinone reductase [Natrinema longum]MBZ6495484.1 NADPH:quinone reductase [Natrinema longum]QSW86547.1 NADPH:quinone reductase [Natrinema longum]